MRRTTTGFTIVELLIVIVVIAILAAITVVAYSGISKRATEAILQSDLNNAAKQLAIRQLQDGSYPNPGLPSDVKVSGSNAFQYTSNGATFCLSATSPNASGSSYYIANGGSITQGLCAGHSATGSSVIANGSTIQSITSANCPATRMRAVDARDNHTYWVQQLSDGKCWMLTNLAYAGGGINTYGDVVTLTNGTGGSITYTDPSYYVVSSTVNFTTEPTNPSTSTDGTGQYGYLYNWCGAMGAQTTTSACANAISPEPSTSTSICPAGWRLPIGGSGGDFQALNSAVNSGATNTDVGLRTNWLAQRGGQWNSGFSMQGSYGFYWSSTQNSAIAARTFYYTSSSVSSVSANNMKTYGYAARCVAM